MKALRAMALSVPFAVTTHLAWAQGLPADTITVADAALEQALAKIEAGAYGEDTTLAKNPVSRRPVEIPRQGRALSLQFTPIGGATVSTSFSKANITHGPEQQLFKLMTEFSQPLFDACASLGGRTTYTYKGRWLSKEVALQLAEFETLAVNRKLSGHHVCEVEGKPVFAFGVTPYGKGAVDFPFKIKVSMITWAVPARDLSAALKAASAEADEFDRMTAEFLANGRAGTPVQVASSALQLDPAALQAAGPWVCGLLVDRKQDLMQVQVGTVTTYVQASAVVPKVTPDAARPGWPAACGVVKAGGR